MKWLVICVLATLMRMDTAEPRGRLRRSTSRDTQCQSGTSWATECLVCSCDALGYAQCTEIQDPACTGAVSRCQPGSQFRRDCSSCVCHQDGLNALCSLDKCEDDRVDTPGIGEPEPVYRTQTSPTNTQPEAQIIELKDSRPDDDVHDHLYDNSLHYISRRSVCKPNTEFPHECNVCRCAADGQTFHCTQNECMDKEDGVNKEVEVFMESEGVDHIERHVVCAPSGTFYAGCNACVCNERGTRFACTNRPCPLPTDVELFHELNESKSAAPKANSTKIVCVPNRMFIKDCNTCWCNEDGTGYICTRKVCVQELPDEAVEDDPEKLRIIKDCRPNEVFELDCNMCVCNADGKSFSCTRRACAQDTVEGANDDKFPAEESLPASSPSSVDQYVRRQRRAAAVPQEPSKQCKPEKEFRLDCNTCLCDRDGQSFSCTRIDCRALNNNHNNHENSEETSARTKRSADSDPNFRCSPGEQFRRGCNECTCSADGKGVFCSLHPCEEKFAIPKM